MKGNSESGNEGKWGRREVVIQGSGEEGKWRLREMVMKVNDKKENNSEGNKMILGNNN